MEVITKVAQFMAQSFKSLWMALGTWGVIGVGIIGSFVLKKIANLMKMIFEF